MTKTDIVNDKLAKYNAIKDLNRAFTYKTLMDWEALRNNLDSMTIDEIVAMTDKFKLEMKND